ncbi:hypothetical protein BLA29_008096, partial [Euroglyphus maynei]
METVEESLIIVPVLLNKSSCDALFDSGASSSFITASKLTNISNGEWSADRKVIRLGNGSTFDSLGRAKLLMTVNGVTKSVAFVVTDKLAHEVMIGLDIIGLFGLELCKDLKVYMNGRMVADNQEAESLSIVRVDENETQLKNLLADFKVLFDGIGKNDRCGHQIVLTSEKVVRHKQQDIPIHWQ